MWLDLDSQVPRVGLGALPTGSFRNYWGLGFRV